MKKLLVTAATAGLLLVSAPVHAQGLFGSLFSGGPAWSNTFPFNSTTAQDKAYNFFNPTPTTGVNAIRPPGTENLTSTANKFIYRFFGVSKSTNFFGLR